MLDFSFTPEQEQMRTVVRDFAERELAPSYAQWDRTGAFPFELWRRMGELGLCGARVAVEYDGQGLDAVTTKPSGALTIASPWLIQTGCCFSARQWLLAALVRLVRWIRFGPDRMQYGSP